jgi:predicted Zn finger-like uncharacterized protein
MEANVTEAITQCPDCQTTFKVTEAQLLVADGSVRCGACLHIFQAERYFVSPLLDKTERLAIAADYWADFDAYVLSAVVFIEPERSTGLKQPTEPEPPSYFDEIPGNGLIEITETEAEIEDGEVELMEFYLDYLVTHPGTVPDFQPGIESPSENEVDAEEGQGDGDALYEEYLAHHGSEGVSGVEEPDEVDIVLMNIAPDIVQDILPDIVPDFELPLSDDHEFLLQDRRRLFTARSLKWLPGIILMIAVAMGQLAFFKMGIYAQRSEYRPTYVLVCRYLGCEVPEYKNYDELRTRELVIRSHPEEPEALLVDVLLLNSGPFRQAFPGLRLQFYDVRGEVVASRVFRASEYLRGEMRGLKLIPAETEVRLSLELVDPGNDALGYQMEVVRL